MLVSLDPSYKVDSQHWEETGSNASEWAVWCWLLPAALCLSVPCLPAPVHTHPQLACPATCWRCLALQTEDISSLSSSVLCIWSFYVPSQLRAHACLSKTIENFCMVGAKDFFSLCSLQASSGEFWCEIWTKFMWSQKPTVKSKRAKATRQCFTSLQTVQELW